MHYMKCQWRVFIPVFFLALLCLARAQDGLPGTTNWVFATKGAVTASPALSEDGSTLYVGSADRFFYALNTEDGSEKWRVKLPGPIQASATIGEDGTIYVPCGNGALYAIRDDESEGSFVWPGPFRTHRSGVASPAIDDDGVIYVGSRDNHLYAVDPADGGRRWAFPARNDAGTPVIAVEGGEETGTIYFSAGARVFGVSPAGAEKSVFLAGSAVHSIPVVDEDGRIYFGANNERVHAVGSGGTTNDVRWRFDTGENVTSSAVIGVNGDIYIASESSRLYCLTTNGVKRWSVSTRRPVHAALSIGADGTIYAGSDDGRMYAVSASGEIRWTVKTRRPIRSAAAIDAQGTVYFGSGDRNVYAIFDQAPSASGENVWQMFRKDRHHTARATGGAALLVQQPLGTNVSQQFIDENVDAVGRTRVVITIGADSLTVTNGANVLVSIVARSGSPFTYQWQLNGEDIDPEINASATTGTLVLQQVQFADAGQYTVELQNQFETLTSEAFTLQVNSAPVFDSGPTNYTILTGNSIILDTRAGGSGRLTYQWRLGGTDIVGATNATLTLSNAQLSDAGIYTLVAANEFGTVTSPAITLRVLPAGVAPANRTVAAGQRHSLAVLPNQTLWAWGLNNFGQLGDGNSGSTGTNLVNRSSPQLIGPGGSATTNAVWASVSAGSRGYDSTPTQPGGFSIGIQTNGTLWAWGHNDRGQLGIGSFASQRFPVKVGSDTNWAQAEAGASHVVARKRDGTLWAWGANESGQLGTGTSVSNSASPVRIGSDAAWVEVRAGGFFSLARRADGTLWAWGTNGHGQLGIGANTGTNATRRVPVQVGTDADWAALSAGAFHSLGLKANGTMWSWGRNNFGQLGLGFGSGTGSEISNTNRPTPVGTQSDWSAIEAGNFHSFGINSSGALFGWGANFYGQLGNGTSGSTLSTNSENRTAPGPIATDKIWRMVDASSHSLGITTDGNIWGWGWNAQGQVGDGTGGDGGRNNDRSVPVLVNFNVNTNIVATNPPVITQQPASQVVNEDATTSFSVVAGGTPVLAYQWYFNSNAIALSTNGTSTDSMLTITNVSRTHEGFYHVIVTNSFGRATSSVARLSVGITNGAPIIVQGPTNQAAATNSTVSFSVTVVGGTPFSYQWRFNVNPLNPAVNPTVTNATLILSNVTTANQGTYDVVVTNSFGSVTSTPQAVLLIPTSGPPPPGLAKAGTPHTLRIESIAVSDVGTSIQVSGGEGFKSLVLERKETWSQAEWTPLRTNLATENVLIDTTPAANHPRYYRVRAE